MWRNLEEEAIYIGLSIDDFWNLNPNQYKKYTSAFNKKKKDTLRNIDYLNHMLGQYISFATNSPKQYPKRPFLYEEIVKNKNMTESEMERQVINNTLMLGGVINGNNSR